VNLEDGGSKIGMGELCGLGVLNFGPRYLEMLPLSLVNGEGSQS
jgi:hypothetical protein